jgi:carboxyl-terminal processing protease
MGNSRCRQTVSRWPNGYQRSICGSLYAGIDINKRYNANTSGSDVPSFLDDYKSMSIKTKAAILVTSFAVLLFMVVGGLGGVRASSNDGPFRQLQVYSEVLNRVNTEYVEEPNIPKVTDGALHGLLEALDPNSSYLSPKEYQEYKAKKSDAKADIGAAVSKRFGYAAVISVIPGGPSDKAGIQGSDIFEAIEGHSTREMSLAEIRALLAGQAGSNVTISVVRARRAEPQKVVVTRDVVSVPNATDKMVDEGVGYVKVDALTKGKAQEIANLIKALQKQGARKLILDLRNSGEGEVSEGIATANLFLNHGTITYLQGQKYPREAFAAEPSKAITNLPVVVLVNRGTAGAAEVVAGAILENARGDVVGDKTFGDGSVQKLIDLPDGAAVIISIAKYYSPSGKAIQDTAITPNILVADTDEDAPLPDEDQDSNTPDDNKTKAPQQDEQLRKAIEVLKNRETKA